jgi:hypothetical protein
LNPTSYDSAALPAGAPRASVPWALELRQMLEIFVRPTQLLERLRDRPAWSAALLTSIGLGILVIVLLPDQVFVDSMQGATTRRGQPVAITSEPSVVAMWERLRLSLGVLVTHPVKAIMLAGLVTLLFGRLLGGTSEFRQHFAATTHALLISALGALVALPLQVLHADPAWQPSLGVVLPGLASLGVAGLALAMVNPFTVWMLLVLAVGVAVMDRRSRGAPVLILLGAYAAALLGIAALQG